MDRDTLAKIDYSICDNCGVCVAKCPMKTIVDTRLPEAEKQVS
jgi:Pyruvate/2-oxoacid:ferredoxin oxidoreductase delta subunit